MIAKNKTASVNEVDFVVPETSAPVLDEAVEAVDDVPADLPSDIPSVDDDLPAMSAEEPVEDDLPDLQ